MPSLLAKFYRQTAIRRPARFFPTAIAKFLREPKVTMKKVRDTFFPGIRTGLDQPSESAIQPATTHNPNRRMDATQNQDALASLPVLSIRE